MGINKTIMGSVLSVSVIFILFSAINKNGENSDNRINLVSEKKPEKTELGANLHLANSRKTDLAPQFEDSVSTDIPANSHNDIVPRIAEFFQTGKMEEIRGLPREDIRIAVEAYVPMQSRDQLAETLHQYLGMPYDLFSSIEEPEDYLMKVVDLVRGVVDQSPPKSNLIITDACTQDGAVSGAVHIIPAGSSKIFAVFENSDALQGIDNVYAVWRDLNDDSLTFSEYEPLHRNAVYNYVWLELKDGWSRGVYQLDLADSKSPSRILATTRFKVQ